MTNTETVSTALNFFASVIKSGEPWTATCQAEFDKAHAALRASRTQSPAEWQVEKAARALSVNHWGDEHRWEMHMDDARVALRAASIHDYKSDAVDALKMYNDEVEAHAATKERLSEDRRELLMVIENVARMSEQGVLSVDGGQAATEIRSLIPLRFRAASIPAPERSKEETGVRPLGPWRRGYCDEQVKIEQASFGGLYQVRVLDGVINLDWPDRTPPAVFDTVEAAKAAAQADYEQRIKSALETPPLHKEGEAVKHSDECGCGYCT